MLALGDTVRLSSRLRTAIKTYKNHHRQGALTNPLADHWHHSFYQKLMSLHYLGLYRNNPLTQCLRLSFIKRGVMN